MIGRSFLALGLVVSSAFIPSCGGDDAPGGSTGGGTSQGGASGSGGSGGSAGTGGTGGTTSAAGGSAGGAGSAGVGGSAGAGVSGSGGSGGAAGEGGAGGSSNDAGTGGAGGSTGTSDAGTEGGTAPNDGGAGAAGFRCPAGATTPSLAGLNPTKIDAVPPADGYSPGFANVEGLVWIGDSLYFSHISSEANPPKSRILKLTGNTVSVFADGVGTNGLAVDGSGNIVGASHKDGSISRYPLSSPTSPSVIAGMYMSKRFDSPNDLTIRRDGTIYFTDPSYQAPAPLPQTKTRVYRVAPAGAVSVVDENLSQPNGITLSIDEQALFVASPGGLYKYAVMADGSTGAATKISGTASDGMAIDCAGNLYLTSNANVVVVSPTGQEVGRIAVTVTNGQSLTNLAFGGADHKTLYISALGSTPGMWKVEMPVAGMPY